MNFFMADKNCLNSIYALEVQKQILWLKPFHHPYKPLAKARGYYKTPFYFQERILA